MKKICKAVIVLSLTLMAISGCSDKAAEPAVTLAGKTFYNTVERYANGDHSKLWLGSDGSFTFSDSYSNGYEQITGSWSQKEDVLTLDVTQSQFGYSQIKFQIEGADRLVLKTGLDGSDFDDVFTTEKPEPSSAPGTQTEVKRYYNASQQGSINVSCLELDLQNSSFVMKDMNDFGIFEYEGTCSFYEDVMTLHSPDREIVFIWAYDMPDVLYLDTDLGVSMSGDIFTLDGDIPQGLETNSGLGEYAGKWINYAASDMASEQYLPYVEFNADGSFVLTENLFAGMGHYRGWYEVKDNVGYICHVEDSSEIRGFAGQDVKTIEFALNDASTIILMTDLCMSMTGNTFTLSKQ